MKAMNGGEEEKVIFCKMKDNLGIPRYSHAKKKDYKCNMYYLVLSKLYEPVQELSS